MKKFTKIRIVISFAVTALLLAYLTQSAAESYFYSLGRTCSILIFPSYFLQLERLKKHLPFDLFVVNYKRVTRQTFVCICLIVVLLSVGEACPDAKTTDMLQVAGKGVALIAFMSVLAVVSSVVIFKIPVKQLISHRSDHTTGQ